VLRAIAVVVLGSALFVVVPEGLGAAWAATLSHTNAGQGADQAMIMMAGPTGAAIGALIISRLVTPQRRHTLIRPLAVVVPGALVPTLLIHSAAVVTGLVVVSGFAAGGLVTSTNHLFVSALPAAFRARAFGVMQFGLQATQAAALVATGLLADHINLPTVVGSWGLAGAAGMVIVGMAWPSATVVETTVAETRARNERAEALAREATGSTAPDAAGSLARDAAAVMPAPDEAAASPQDQATPEVYGREPAGGGHPAPGPRNRWAARATERPPARPDLSDHDLSRGTPAQRPVA
jgi:hypothetical protein